MMMMTVDDGLCLESQSHPSMWPRLSFSIVTGFQKQVSQEGNRQKSYATIGILEKIDYFNVLVF